MAHTSQERHSQSRSVGYYPARPAARGDMVVHASPFVTFAGASPGNRLCPTGGRTWLGTVVKSNCLDSARGLRRAC